MRPILRLCLAAFLMDMALYLSLTGIPYKALALGAGSLALGFLPMAYSLPYSVSAGWAGRRTETGDRLRVARVGLLLVALAMASLIWADRMPWVFAAPAVVGVMLGFYWPQLQATLADVTAPSRLTPTLGWFNVSWSLGKGMGYLVGGVLLARFGFTALFAMAAACVLAVAWVLRGISSERSGPASPAPGGGLQEEGGVPLRGVKAGNAHSGEPHLLPAQAARPGLLPAAWVGNFVCFGAAAALNFHYPQWLESQGRSETVFGTYLGLIFASETVAFLLLRRFDGWRFRVTPVLVAPLPAIAALLLLPSLEAQWMVLLTAPAVGLGLGMAYFASVFYSVHDRSHRGRNAGIHEASLALGAVVLPLAGGLVATLTDSLRAPYLTAAVLGVVAILLQAGMLLVSGRRSRAT